MKDIIIPITPKNSEHIKPPNKTTGKNNKIPKHPEVEDSLEPARILFKVSEKGVSLIVEDGKYIDHFDPFESQVIFNIL